MIIQDLEQAVVKKTFFILFCNDELMQKTLFLSVNLFNLKNMQYFTLLYPYLSVYIDK